MPSEYRRSSSTHRDRRPSWVERQNSLAGRRASLAESYRASVDIAPGELGESYDLELCLSNALSRQAQDDGNLAPAESVGAPYCIYHKKKIYFITLIAALSGLLSPMTSSIYLPVLTNMSEDLHVSQEDINLTLTLYMIFQGISPSIFSRIGDTMGRRPAYLMSFSVYLAANIVLSCQHSYPVLLVFRMVQASGAASSIALGAGTISDIISPSNRGFFMGLFSAGVFIGPSIAPVVGGALSITKHGYNTCFYLLSGLGFLILMTHFSFMSETSRQIRGNGSVRPTKWYSKSLVYMIRHKAGVDNQAPEDFSTLSPRKKFAWSQVIDDFKVLLEPDVFLVLFSSALIYTTYYCITTAFSIQLSETLNVPPVLVGVCFLAPGIGATLAALTTGRILDYFYKKTAKKHGFPTSTNKQARADPTFPYEEARMMPAWPFVILIVPATILFGWTLRSGYTIVPPLILSFVCGYASTAVFTCTSVIMVDLYPYRPSSVTAVNNIVRCCLGGAGTALISRMIDSMGMGWCFTMIGLILLVLCWPMFYIEQKYGSRFRLRRAERVAKAQEEEDIKAEKERQFASATTSGTQTPIESDIDDLNAEKVRKYVGGNTSALTSGTQTPVEDVPGEPQHKE